MVFEEKPSKSFFVFDDCFKKSDLYNVTIRFAMKDLFNGKEATAMARWYYIRYKSKVIKRLFTNEMREAENEINLFLQNYLEGKELDKNNYFSLLVKMIVDGELNFYALSEIDFRHIFNKTNHEVSAEDETAWIILGYEFCFPTLGMLAKTRKILKDESKKIFYGPLIYKLLQVFSNIVRNLMFNVINAEVSPKTISQVNSYFDNASLIWACFSEEVDAFDRISNGDLGFYLIQTARIAFMEGVILERNKTYSEESIATIESLSGKISVDKRWSKHKAIYYPIISDAIAAARKMWEEGSELKNDKMLKLLLNDSKFIAHRDKIEWKLKEELKKVAEKYGKRRLSKSNK